MENRDDKLNFAVDFKQSKSSNIRYTVLSVVLNLHHVFFSYVLWSRGAGWSRQQGELYWGVLRWHGMLHRILGQLPQDMELRLFLTGEQKESS